MSELADPSAASPTWSVGELHEAVSMVLAHTFGEQIWVQGEVRNLNRSKKGHVYFDLVEPDRDGDPARPALSVTLFNTERLAVNQFLRDQGDPVRMRDGIRIRIRGRLGVYGARSTLQLVMAWIDPTHTLGVMGEQRDRVLAALAADGLLDANAGTAVAVAPLRIALVTSVGSAAHADALHELSSSSIGFRVSVLDTRTQGADAPRSIVAALALAGRGDHDLVLLVRGGGARTDLIAFDDEQVCRAIAAAPLPVFTGIGHEIDRTAADDVAHSSHKTPTAAAAAVAALAERFAGSVHDLEVQVASAALGRLARSAGTLEQLSARAGRAGAARIVRARDALDQLERRSAAAAPRTLGSARAELERQLGGLAAAARRGVDAHDRRLDGLAARARAHDPATALARGWSITRRSDGTILTDPQVLHEGERLVTTTAGGTVASVVEPAADGAPNPEDRP